MGISVFKLELKKYLLNKLPVNTAQNVIQNQVQNPPPQPAIDPVQIPPPNQGPLPPGPSQDPLPFPLE